MKIKIAVYFISAMLSSASLKAMAQVYDDSIVDGSNFKKAAFRLWCPENISLIKGVLVLVPGSNFDGRNDYMDIEWQKFAKSNQFAILACYFLDIDNPVPIAETYANARNGSGQALIDAIKRMARKSGHAEINNAPLLLWGFSAGGQFNYEFACWKPEKTLAFVVNKGGIYYTALAPLETRSVPAIFFTGGSDLVFRNEIIEGIFAINRRLGAIWTYASEPAIKHEIGLSRSLAILYFNDIIALRMPKESSNSKNNCKLNLLTNESGLLGDPLLMQIENGENWKNKVYPTSWLPTKIFADNWLNYIGLKSK
jgi:hypothetical protein